MKKYHTIILGLIVGNSFNIANGQSFTDKSIVIGTNTISYLDSGNSVKEQTTLLFVHGSFINKEYWDKQLSYFSTTYRVVAIDLPGHGNSTHNGVVWTIQQYGDDVNEIINKLALENVIVIGHSIGGDVMLEAKVKNNKAIIGIIGIDCFKNVGVELPKKDIDGLTEKLKTDFVTTNEQYAKTTLLTTKTDPVITNKVLTDFRTINPKVGLPLNVDFFNYPKRETELLQRLKMKLYLINVNYSPTNEESLKKIIGNNYELNVINGTCHYPMIENPKAFNLLLEKTILKIKK